MTLREMIEIVGEDKVREMPEFKYLKALTEIPHCVWRQIVLMEFPDLAQAQPEKTRPWYRRVIDFVIGI